MENRKKNRKPGKRRSKRGRWVFAEVKCGKIAFSQRLKALRQKQGKSYIVISELCGLSSDMIRRYERGEVEPGMRALIAIVDYFQVSIDDLVGRDG